MIELLSKDDIDKKRSIDHIAELGKILEVFVLEYDFRRTRTRSFFQWIFLYDIVVLLK